MAGSLETNKILAALLTAGIFASGAGVMSRIIYNPTAPAEPAYIIEVAEEGGEGSGGDGGGEEVSLAALLAGADMANGESGAKKCASCHTFEGEEDKIGPHLQGVVGREIGSVSGFAYSDAMAGHGGTWDYESLDAFLADPKGYISGTKMAFAGVRGGQDRADLIVYLQSVSPDAPPLPEPEAEGGENAEGAEGGEGEGADAEAADAGEEPAEETEETAEASDEAADDTGDAAEETAADASDAETDEASDAAGDAEDAAADASSDADDATTAAADEGTEQQTADAEEPVDEADSAAAGTAEDAAGEGTEDAPSETADAAEEGESDGEETTVAAVDETAEDEAAAGDAAGGDAAGGLAALVDAGDVGEGEKVAKKCKACHVFEEGGKNKLGPVLHGVVDREIASYEGFNYSGALKELEGAWTIEMLDQFLEKPKDLVPGTKMVFAGVKKEEDRANLIAYLRSLGGDG